MTTSASGQPLLRNNRLSDGGPPPGVCVWRGRGHGAFHHLHGAYLGEEVKPTPRKVEGESE